MIKKITFYFLFLFPFFSIAQNCVVNVSTDTVCLGNTVSFSVTYNSGLIVKNFTWTYGDATIGTVSLNNSKLYTSAGTYTPSLLINFTNNTSCTVNVPPITVFNKAAAKFAITSQDTQCFKNNLVCIKDISTKGTGGAGIKSKLILWGDGTFVNENPATGNTNYCTSYTSPFGRLYTIVLELTDSNNCVSRLEKKDSILIWTAMQPISFMVQTLSKCDTTTVTFINTSQFPQNQAKKFYWYFGDGTSDLTSTKWTNLTHKYTTSGSFTPKFIVENLNGCTDTFSLNNGIQNVHLGDKITILPVSKCAGQLDYTFSVGSSGSLISYTWKLSDLSGNVLGGGSQPEFKLNKGISTCGQYKLNAVISYKTCSKSIDTTFDVYGPIAKIFIGTPPQHINQCHITDTVFFITPNLDVSCYYKNTIKRLWDFADPFAPPCTLDTKNNINIGMNCRFSKDSARVKHWYTPGKEFCYLTTLSLIDPITNCSSTDTANVSLMPPNAKPGLSETPSRKGLIFEGKECLNQPIFFDIKETLPLCSRNGVWIKQDSADITSIWQKMDSSKTKFPIIYTKTTDPKGWVTVGLIIKNGNCYDTGWYHYALNIVPFDPGFRISITGTCQPYLIKLVATDTIQDSLVQARWLMNDAIISTQNFALKDSVIKTLIYNQKKQGVYNFLMSLTNRKGCNAFHDTTVVLGFAKAYSYNKPVICFGDSLQLFDSVFYYTSNNPYWNNKARATSNKEKLWWQVNNEGYNFQGSMPKIGFNKIGNYKITMVAKDSLNCTDTFSLPDKVKVVQLKAGIKSMRQLYVCAPKIALFKDSTTIIDSSALYSEPSYDAVASRTWVFGDNKNDAFVIDPVHEYTANSKYKAYLAVQSVNGCVDTAFIDIEVKGPDPSFTIKGDTFGCSPVSIILKNTTGRQIDDWIWTARGPINYVISTQKDTNITFTFTKAGVYNLHLYGNENVLDPFTNTTQSCVGSYPDTLNPSAPVYNVRVIDRPKLTITAPDSVCINQEFFIKTSFDEVFANYTIDWGDKTTRFADTSEKILSHSYKVFGNYVIKLLGHTTQSIACVDTPIANIYVRNIKADFSFDDSKNPVFQFKNLTLNASTYKWIFTSGDSSSEENPSFDYAKYISADSIKVCLIASNIQGCIDTVCKKIYPYIKALKIPNVFTPDGDGKNDAFDIDIKGNSKYELTIYNRWGETVFESTKDGDGNDENNWNGKEQNTGTDCASGVYFYIFKYRNLGQNNDVIERGTITLIK